MGPSSQRGWIECAGSLRRREPQGGPKEGGDLLLTALRRPDSLVVADHLPVRTVQCQVPHEPGDIGNSAVEIISRPVRADDNVLSHQWTISCEDASVRFDGDSYPPVRLTVAFAEGLAGGNGAASLVWMLEHQVAREAGYWVSV